MQLLVDEIRLRMGDNASEDEARAMLDVLEERGYTVTQQPGRGVVIEPEPDQDEWLAMLEEAVNRATAEAVRRKLGLDADELEALFGALPHPVRGGPDGRLVAAEIRRRFGLPDNMPLGEALHQAGVLTDNEARWLDE